MAQFKSPAGLFALDANTLLLTDSGNHLIRRISLGTMASTVALAGAAGVTGAEDGGFAVARFNTPSAVVGGGGSTVFVAEQQNHVIRALDLNTNRVSTSAGLALIRCRRWGGLLGPLQHAAGSRQRRTRQSIHRRHQQSHDPQAQPGYRQRHDHRRHRYPVRPGRWHRRGGPLFSPWAVVGDGAGSLYISDTGNHAIRKLELASGTVTTLAGNLTNTAATPGSSDGDGTAASFNRPVGLAYDGQGSLFVADSANNTLRQIAVASGRVTTVAGLAGAADNVINASGSSARFSSPYGVACDRKGNVYVSDSTGHVIRKVVVATRTVTTPAGTAGQSGLVNGSGTGTRFYNPLGISIDLAGFLYVADSTNYAIRRIDVNTSSVTTYVSQSPARSGVKLGPLPGRLNNPGSVLWLDGSGPI